LGRRNLVCHLEPDAIEQPRVHMRVPRVPAGTGDRGIDACRSEVGIVQESGLKPHVGDFDFLLIRSSGFLVEIDLLQVGINREPDVRGSDRCPV
jgi:hypothetical protein